MELFSKYNGFSDFNTDCKLLKYCSEIIESYFKELSLKIGVLILNSTSSFEVLLSNNFWILEIFKRSERNHR